MYQLFHGLDHGTTNTFNGFRDSVLVLKIHSSYQDTQLSIPLKVPSDIDVNNPLKDKSRILGNRCMGTFVPTPPPPHPLLLLLMIHHGETQLNANRNRNSNPKGGTKVQQRRYMLFLGIEKKESKTPKVFQQIT